MKICAAAVIMLAGTTYGAVILAEDFEGGVIPADWTVVDNAGGGLVFQIFSPSTIDGSMYMAGWDSDAVAGDYDTELWTPAMNLSGAPDAAFTYSADYQNFAGYDYFDVDVSYDGGATWATLVSYNVDMGVFTETLTLNGGSANTHVRFHYYDPTATGDWDWYAFVDNISVEAVPAPGTLALLGLGMVARRRR